MAEKDGSTTTTLVYVGTNAGGITYAGKYTCDVTTNEVEVANEDVDALLQTGNFVLSASGKKGKDKDKKVATTDVATSPSTLVAPSTLDTDKQQV